jgi:acetyl-CoA carboxylase biotin carboxyl carrier protein
MDYEKLIDLIDHIDQSSLAYMDYETEEQHIILSKEVPQLNVKQEPAPFVEQSQPMNTPAEVQTEADPVMAPIEEEAAQEVAGEAVESPMVGVVYLQPKPDEDPYVKVGDRVEQGDVICIVEAMKLMNEIQAPRSGIITEILVENEEVVEYKQPLIRIDD